MSVRLLTTADQREWEAALPAGASVYGSLGFARVQEGAGAGSARLLVDATRSLAYPLVLRPLAPLGLGEPEGAAWDAASPPFTGPLGEAGGELAEEVGEALAAAGVVAEFAHLHPWRGHAEPAGGAEPDREIVWVDLTLGEEERWRESYSRSCRKNVNRAHREGVTVRAATADADIEEFHRIYIATMERNRARPEYFFDLGYFQAIRRELGEHARFALADRMTDWMFSFQVRIRA